MKKLNGFNSREYEAVHGTTIFDFDMVKISCERQGESPEVIHLRIAPLELSDHRQMALLLVNKKSNRVVFAGKKVETDCETVIGLLGPVRRKKFSLVLGAWINVEVRIHGFMPFLLEVQRRLVQSFYPFLDIHESLVSIVDSHNLTSADINFR
jgi:hypothetical protein